jgi:glutaredoxin
MAWKWLGSWRRRTRDRGPDVAAVVLYTRRGCHLCDDARALLERAGRRYALSLTAVDVDADPDLAARFGLEVPVVEVNGRVRFRGVVNEILLDRLLRALTILETS